MSADRDGLARLVSAERCRLFAWILARCHSRCWGNELTVPAVGTAQQVLDHELVAGWLQELAREWRAAAGQQWVWSQTRYDWP